MKGDSFLIEVRLLSPPPSLQFADESESGWVVQLDSGWGVVKSRNGRVSYNPQTSGNCATLLLHSQVTDSRSAKKDV